MKLGFSEPQRHYDSGSQNARTQTESWVAESMFCPNCGYGRLNKFPANLPVADFFCEACNDQYELKSQKKEFGKKVVDGAYETKIERLKSNSSPNLILMRYDSGTASVKSLCVIPKRFFLPAVVERRKPLSSTARRAGWVGSNILLDKIPTSGRVYFVLDQIILPKESILAQWQKTAFLDNQPQSAKGWLIEVMNCVDRLDGNGFTLDEVYRFESHLHRLYPGNNNVRPKIRQQLQLLRDNGYIEFLGNGRYRLVP